MFRSSVLFIAAIYLIVGCGVPGKKLNVNERKADLNWAFDLIDHNYAPKDWKKENLQIDLDAVRAECLTSAEEDMDNKKFMSLFQKCLHSTNDAHVSVISNAVLPEDATISHLGFNTERKKLITTEGAIEALYVSKMAIGSVSRVYPIRRGDFITKIDGVEVVKYLEDNIYPYINLGQVETNLTIAAKMFAVRSSLRLPIPEADSVTLTVKRGLFEIDITTPWLKVDQLTYIESQTKKLKPFAKKDKTSTHLSVKNPLIESFVGYGVITKIANLVHKNVIDMTTRGTNILEQTFKFVNFDPVLNHILAQDNSDNEGDVNLEKQEKKNLSKFYIGSRNAGVNGQDLVQNLLQKPGFLVAKLIIKPTGKRFAYVQIGGFPGDDRFVKEFQSLVSRMNQLNVSGLVLDMIDNGGGSLIHGMRIANMLNEAKLEYPMIQVALNNSWVNSFRSQAVFGQTDAEKIMAKNITKIFKEDMAADKRLSRPISIVELDPFVLTAPKNNCANLGTCLKPTIKVALVVNEMCASMCDIFASVVHDNKLGVIVGQKTMGAGGNVVQHAFSPISKIMISVTESLIVDKDGKYLENNGVEPDEKVDMVSDRYLKFSTSLAKAFSIVAAE